MCTLFQLPWLAPWKGTQELSRESTRRVLRVVLRFLPQVQSQAHDSPLHLIYGAYVVQS